MSAPAAVAGPRPRRRGWVVALVVTLGIALFLGANIHLLYVAATSQPQCVPHAKAPGEAGSYQAAKSAC